MKLRKNKKQETDSRKQSRSIICLAASCCILICTFLLSTVCWAWFTSSTSAGFELQTAMYGAKVTIVKQGTTIADQQIISTYGNLWELENGYVYDVTIAATGNANTGHCKIILADTTRNTGNLSSGSELQFQIKLTGSGTTWMQIMASWGACNTYYYGAPIAAGEVVTVGPVQIPPEPQETPTEETLLPDETEGAGEEPVETDPQPADTGSTEQPSEESVEPADTGNTEQPSEESVEPADAGSTQQPQEGDSQNSDTQ